MTRSDKKSKKTHKVQKIEGLIKTKHIKQNWRLIKKSNTFLHKSEGYLNNQTIPGTIEINNICK